MIKIDLARTLAERLGTTQKEADDFLKAFIEVVGETLENGKPLQLAGFGQFTLRHIPEHQGRNPKTGKEILVPACYYPIFRAGKGLKERVAKHTPTDHEDSIDPEAERTSPERFRPSPKPARKKKSEPPS